ncbi:competence protein CoiA family protein, partial [Deinococcus multiflagellatus]|uniref:hypothetical protein n=1 Tax=Deinococcus multiflagellatus TaxID=1656887 RepID=UPI001CCCB76D
MRYAWYNGERVEAISGKIGRCECCDADVQGCYGAIRRYWRHLNVEDCDTWSENEGPWHREWKARFTASQSQDEVTIRKPGDAVGHRADIQTRHKVVIELQHSYLAANAVQARERFYGELANGMMWLFDLTEKSDNFELKD